MHYCTRERCARDFWYCSHALRRRAAITMPAALESWVECAARPPKREISATQVGRRPVSAAEKGTGPPGLRFG